jgi:hypothetical protein
MQRTFVSDETSSNYSVFPCLGALGVASHNGRAAFRIQLPRQFMNSVIEYENSVIQTDRSAVQCFLIKIH